MVQNYLFEVCVAWADVSERGSVILNALQVVIDIG